MQAIQPRKRRMSRRFAMQGIYQWALTQNDVNDIVKQLMTPEYSRQMDEAFFLKLLKGVIADYDHCHEVLKPVLDRELSQIDPIERATLLLAVYEFEHCLESPYRVVINEAIELAKIYGAEDSFKYVNAVLAQLMPILRPIEWQASGQV